MSAILYKDDMTGAVFATDGDKVEEVSPLVMDALQSEFDRKVERIESDKDFLRERNAELNHVVSLVCDFFSHDRCEGCVHKSACNAGDVDMCWIARIILDRAKGLGFEVDVD